MSSSLFRIACLSLCLSLLLPLPALAQAKSADPPKPPPLAELEKGGALLKYLGREQGLDGWITVKNGRIEYFYATPDGQGVVLGVMFDAKGDSVTAKQLKYAYTTDPAVVNAVGGNSFLEEQAKQAIETKQAQAQAAPAAAASPAAADGKPKSEMLWERLGKSHYFTIGKKGAPAAFVFVDPQCSHCKEFLREVRSGKFLDSHALNIIPVAVINEQSVKMSAALLESSTAESQLWAAVDKQKNAIPVGDSPDISKVRDNLQIMLDYKFDVTPLIIYRGADGKVKLVKGGPSDLPAMMADIR